MTKYTKTEGTQEIWDALDDFYDYDLLAIRPEIYSEDGETFIYLNLVILTSENIYSFIEGLSVSVELGRYDNDDDETEVRAYKKAMKAAREFDIHVTEPA